MEDIRMKLFWHPVHGELAKLPGDEYSYENKDTIANDTPLYIDQPMETVYQRDRRLWVEQAISMELTNQGVLLTDTQIEHRAKYYLKAYDLIQNVIFQNQ